MPLFLSETRLQHPSYFHQDGVSAAVERQIRGIVVVASRIDLESHVGSLQSDSVTSYVVSLPSDPVVRMKEVVSSHG